MLRSFEALQLSVMKRWNKEIMDAERGIVSFSFIEHRRSGISDILNNTYNNYKDIIKNFKFFF